MSRLAVLAVLLLGSAMLAQADDSQCQVTLSKAPDSTTVAPGSNVTMAALVACDVIGRRTLSPVDPGQAVQFRGAYKQGLVFNYAALCNPDDWRSADPILVEPPFRFYDPCNLKAPLRQDLLKQRVLPDNTDYDIVLTPTGADGTAFIRITTPGEGAMEVLAIYAIPDTVPPTSKGSNFVNVTWLSPPARLSLLPHKAVRHCGQPIKITARLLRKDNTPIAGATITFGVTGDCVPKLSGKVATTDADGYATLHLFSEEPGVVAVVAAAVGANGMPLLFVASKVIFMEEGHDEGYYREDAAKLKDLKDHQYADAASKQALAEIRAQRN